MTISFCGHRNFYETTEIRNIMMTYLCTNAMKEELILYSGHYGAFDLFAESCGRELKKQFPSTKLIFVTPYLDENYLKYHTADFQFDGIEYPNLEKVPLQFSIVRRNKYIIDNADLVIAYVEDRIASGAYKTLEYAVRKNKRIINLANLF